MGIFNDNDMTDFGLLAQDLAFNDTCQIQEVTRTPDGERGATLTWTTVNTVPCFTVLVPTKIYESTLADRDTFMPILTLAVPRLTAITIASRVVFRGTTYDVIGVSAETSYEVIRHVSLSKEAA